MASGRPAAGSPPLCTVLFHSSFTVDEDCTTRGGQTGRKYWLRKAALVWPPGDDFGSVVTGFTSCLGDWERRFQGEEPAVSQPLSNASLFAV